MSIIIIFETYLFVNLGFEFPESRILVLSPTGLCGMINMHCEVPFS